jgi:hypothetical protein
MKTCSKCNIEKPLTEFYRRKASKNSLLGTCKLCEKERGKSYRQLNSEKEKERKMNWKKNNPNYHSEYCKSNRTRINQTVNNNFENNPIEKLKKNYRNRFVKYINRKKIPSNTILGCDWDTFKTYLESKFIQDMNWNNYGQFGWHLDHIIPLATAKTEEELYKLNHYTNLQPLWWRDNLSKSDKIVEY